MQKTKTLKRRKRRRVKTRVPKGVRIGDDIKIETILEFSKPYEIVLSVDVDTEELVTAESSAPKSIVIERTIVKRGRHKGNDIIFNSKEYRLILKAFKRKRKIYVRSNIRNTERTYIRTCNST